MHDAGAIGRFGAVRIGANGVLGIVTGMGAINAAVVTTAIGHDPRFDLTRAYWLIAGLGGVDPEDASLGSAIWSRFVVDGDLAHEIDPRELPATWSTNRFVLNTVAPYAPVPERAGTAFGVQEVYRLNPRLCAWAHALTCGIELADSPEVARARAGYASCLPRAATPPAVQIGDTLAASTYWHGVGMNTWANRWVEHHTAGEGRMVVTVMEDAGRVAAIEALGRLGRADPERLLLLRTGCNYSRQPDGTSVLASLGGDTGASPFVAEEVALENMLRVGSAVVDALLAGWSRWQGETPS